MQLIHTVFEPRGDGPYPTILALHGWGANALDLLGLAPHLCGGRCLVLCPQGPVQMSLGPGAFGYGWYPLSAGGQPDMQAVNAAQEHLNMFLAMALERYPIDTQQLVVLGFSQGGVIAYRLALSAPQRFAALAALSTWLPPAFLADLSSTSSYPPALIQHGTRDELVVVDRARQSVEALRPLGIPVTYREYDMQHEINARSLTDLSTWLQERAFATIRTI